MKSLVISKKMWKSFLKVASVALFFTMMMNVALPVFAAQNEENNMALERINKCRDVEQKLLKSAIYNPEFTNTSELSTSDQELVYKITKNPNLYLAAAEVVEGQVVLIYNTSDADVKIAITDSYVEVIKFDNNTVFINGEEHHFEISETLRDISLTHLPPNAYPIDYHPGCSWTYVQSWTQNFIAPNPFVSYSVGALATIISHFLGFTLGETLVFGVASAFITSEWGGTRYADFDHHQFVGHIDDPPGWQTYFYLDSYYWTVVDGERKTMEKRTQQYYIVL